MRALSRFLASILVVIPVLRRLVRRRDDDAAAGADPEVRTVEREAGAARRAELVVCALLLAAAACAAGFVVALLSGNDPQAEAALFGGGLLLAGVAAAVAANFVFPRETAEEAHPPPKHPGEPHEVARIVRSGADGVTRRKLIAASAGAAGVSLAAAAAVPVTALGPSVGESIADTPWRRGRVLVDEEGKPLRADDVGLDGFVTAFPEGADPRELGSPVVVVREDPRSLRLPPERRNWAPDGIVAYSKICTHAGCAIALYRQPLSQETSLPPGLACPCHYSVFDPREAGKVKAGPAGRPLPQLPLTIGADRVLRAGGGFSGAIGPAWWNVRRTS